MLRDIEKFKNKNFDLLIIGGGINGSAIAHLSAKEGMKVALLEKGDFASGTSSKSTKLMHGGIRYLENLELDLVYESLRERYIQLTAAPHLVKPLQFIIPVYKKDKRPLWMMHLGVFLYDLLAGKYKIKKHKRLNKKEVLEKEPSLKKEGLLGGLTYYDAQMDDARVCLENVLSADEAGASVSNYVKTISFIKENGKAVGVIARDELGGEKFEIRAKKIICAAGPWTNELLRIDHHKAKKRIRMTKGVHIVYKEKITNSAILVTSKSDKRIFFVIPWKDKTLIGTTDTAHVGNPDFVKTNKEDIDYLLNEAERVFPGIQIDKEKIIHTFAGLRPLIRKWGSPSKVSRRHLFHETPSGIIFVVGGKYTTYRRIAELCVNKIKKGSDGKEFKLFGSGAIKENPGAVASQYGVDIKLIQNLIKRYGARYKNVLELIKERPILKEKIFNNPPITGAEIFYSLKTEMAEKAEDVLDRRLSIECGGDVKKEYILLIEKFISENKV